MNNPKPADERHRYSQVSYIWHSKKSCKPILDMDYAYLHIIVVLPNRYLFVIIVLSKRR